MSTAADAWIEVGDGCFQRRYSNLDLSVGVVRGSDGLLVIDTRCHDGEAEELLRDLRRLGGPVRAVVNTHWHYDHVFGNHRFLRQAADPDHDLVTVRPDLPILGHRAVPRMLATHGEAMREALVEHLEKADPDQAKQLEAVVITPPNQPVTVEARLDLGDRPVELLEVGRGHTSNDLVVLVPQSSVTFAGDLVEESGPPAFGDDCYPMNWWESLETLGFQAPEGFTVVPGHGAAVDHGFVEQQSEMLRRVADTIERLFHDRVPVERALEAGAGSWPYPTEVLVHAVSRGYRQLAPDHGDLDDLGDGDAEGWAGG